MRGTCSHPDGISSATGMGLFSRTTTCWSWSAKPRLHLVQVLVECQELPGVCLIPRGLLDVFLKQNGALQRIRFVFVCVCCFFGSVCVYL